MIFSVRCVFLFSIFFFFPLFFLFAQQPKKEQGLPDLMNQLDDKTANNPFEKIEEEGFQFRFSNRFADPIYMDNQQLMFSVFGLPSFESAFLNSHLEFSFRYTFKVTNEYYFRTSGGQKEAAYLKSEGLDRCLFMECIIFDYEKAENLFSFRFGLFDWMELGLDLRYFFFSSGYLDTFVDNFHHAFEFTEGGRNNIENYRFLIIYVRNNELLYYIPNFPGPSIGDTLLTLSFQLYVSEDKTESLAMRLRYDAPTGRSEHFYGNGEADGGIEFSYSNIDVGGWFSFHTALGGYKLGRFDLMNRINTETDITNDSDRFQKDFVFYIYTGFNFEINDNSSIKSSLHFNTPYYYDSRIEALNSYNAQVIVGWAFRVFENFYIEAGLSEDPITGTSPDFTTYLDFNYFFR